MPPGGDHDLRYGILPAQSVTDPRGNLTSSAYDRNGDRRRERPAARSPGGTTRLSSTHFAYDATAGCGRTTAPDGSDHGDGLRRPRAGEATSIRWAATDRLRRSRPADAQRLPRRHHDERPTTPRAGAPLTDRGAERPPTSTTRPGGSEEPTFPDGSVTQQSTTTPAGSPVDRRAQQHHHLRLRRSGRRTTIIDALNRSPFAYDAAGNQIAVTDPRGNTTAFVYDDAGRLTRTIRRRHQPRPRATTRWDAGSPRPTRRERSPASATTPWDG